MTIEVRITVGGFVVRLFHKRADAINDANARTKILEQQCREVRTNNGYIVRNVVTGDCYDAMGLLPKDAATALFP